MKISVCLASYNGAAYIAEQLHSILSSTLINEVVVSDDGSTDKTRQIIESIGDSRVRLIDGPGAGVIRNFEFALAHASGDIIFLSDQDDVWLPGKVEQVVPLLAEVDLVVTDCRIVDGILRELQPSFFRFNRSAPGLLRNLVKNSYLGCCMVMRRQLLEVCLPFPADLPMHDWWIGLVAEKHGKVRFLDDVLSLYRRHGTNASFAGEQSRVPLSRRLSWRLYLAYHLFLGARVRKPLKRVS